MRKPVLLGSSGITTSRIGVGTSRLHYLRSSDRRRLLDGAFDAGVIHFDTAPSYGDGLAERALGAFVRDRRDRVVVATKVGFAADPLIERWPGPAMPLRGLRAAARKFGFWQSRPLPLTATAIRGSVEQSLRRMKTGWIDILFLHEPSLERLPSPSEAWYELVKLREEGLVRAFGLAGSWQPMRPVLSVAPELGMLVQTAEAEWSGERLPDITYGAIATASQQYWSRSVPEDVARDRLRTALARRPHGVVLISTTRMDHLRHLASVQAQ